MRLWKQKREDRSTKIELLTITPPRTGERTLLGIENLFQSFAVEEAFSLEISGTVDGASFLVRTRSPGVFRQQLAIHYPQARIRGRAATEEDPHASRRGRAGVREGPDFGPAGVPAPAHLQGRRHAGRRVRPAAGGARSPEQPERSDQRLAARLVLRSLGPSWSEQYQRKSLVPPMSPVMNPSYQYQTRPLKVEGIGMIIPAGADRPGATEPDLASGRDAHQGDTA